MRTRVFKRRSIRVLSVTLGVLIGGGAALAAKPSDSPKWIRHETNLRLGNGLRAIAVNVPAVSSPTLAAKSTGWPHPQPPLAGFSPLVAVAASNERKTQDYEWAHTLRTSYSGTPLASPVSEHFCIGIFDSGSTADLIDGCDAPGVGITESYLTSNTVGVSGVSGTVEVPITKPLGIFAAGLGAVSSTGTLDDNQLVGHTNVAALVLPEDDCEATRLPSIIGTDLLSFFNTIIRIDQPRHVIVDGQKYQSPDVQIQSTSATLPSYPRKIAMLPGLSEGGDAAFATTNYLGDIFSGMGDPDVPMTPSLLATSDYGMPTGGVFFAEMYLLQGEASPTNPAQLINVMIDTGAQSCIISRAMVANLNLDLDNPHFTMEVQGIGGVTTQPGYYLDYVKINASGGAFEFSRVPVVAIDVSSPGGTALDGVMGMNLFWNRNVIFQPALSGTGFFQVSDPISLAYGDFDRDLDVDADDLAIFESCTSGAAVSQTSPACIGVDFDGDDDVDQSDFGIFQRCITGQNIPADPTCSQ